MTIVRGYASMFGHAQPHKGDALLPKLRDYYRAYGVLPSYQQMAALIDLKAKSWIYSVVKKLERDEYLTRTPLGQLMPGPKFNAE
jgi:SOS-response transcriptional repressor LexA